MSPTKGVNSMFSCTWVQFYKRGVGRWPRGWVNPLTGLRLDQCCSRATSYKLPHSSFGIFQIRNSHIEQTVVEKGSKRIYWTSKCFCHAIKHLGSCVKHTLTLRPRKFVSSWLLKPLHIILWPRTGNQCLLWDQNKIGEMGSDWNMFVIVVVH